MSRISYLIMIFDKYVCGNFILFHALVVAHEGLEQYSLFVCYFFFESLCAIILIDLSKYFHRITFVFIKFIINKVDEQYLCV